MLLFVIVCSEVMLSWKGEWHPFTLTSAPEERHLTLHIRASSSMDWCSALRRHLMLEAPRAAQGTEAAETKLKSN